MPIFWSTFVDSPKLPKPRNWTPLNRREADDLIERAQTQSGIRKQLVLIHPGIAANPFYILSCTKALGKYCWIKMPAFSKKCSFYVKNELICTISKIARNMTREKIEFLIAKKAMRVLKQDCFTIIRKRSRDVIDFKKSDYFDDGPPFDTQTINIFSYKYQKMDTVKKYRNPIRVNNIYIEYPIDRLLEQLRQLKASKDRTMWIFDGSFNEFERKTMISWAKIYHLHPTIEFNDGQEVIVMYKEIEEPWVIVDRLLRIGGEDQNYILDVPGRFKKYLMYK